MTRLSVPCVLLVAGFATAQDMPLSEIIRPGENWRTLPGNLPPSLPRPYRVDADKRTIVFDPMFNYSGKNLEHSVKQPTACMVALGGSQLLVTDASDRYVWAFRIEKDGTLGPGDRYCRLRVLGDERRKKDTPAEKYVAEPSAITTDSANRTYVATNLGIQIFDPTGRLCGVVTAPPGRVTYLVFFGNDLYASAEGKSYVRKMLAEGDAR